MFWIYVLPNWLLAVFFTGGFAGLTWLAHVLIRPQVRHRVVSEHDWNHLLGHVIANHGVLYGVLLALVALATFENHAEVEAIVNHEAASLAALYRDVSSYPAPLDGELQESLRGYNRYVIAKEWPAMTRGVILDEGVERVTAFQRRLFGFEPGTKGQEILHAEAVRQFNVYVEARRQRLESVSSGLPAVWWYVVAAGALLGVLLTACLRVESAAAHLGLALAFNLLVSMIFFLLVVMDHPLRGGVRITPEAFEIVERTLVTRGG